MRGRRAPLSALLAAPAAAGAALLVIPLVALVTRVPWTELHTLLAREEVGLALRVSLVSAGLAAVTSVVLGVPLAWVLVHSRLPGRRLLRTLVTLPLVLPPVVGGLALLLALGRHGLFGPLLEDAFGVRLAFSAAGVVVAETFVAMPFLVVAVEGALRSADGSAEEAAATLGAGPWRTFTRVTLPLIGPAVAAGAVLSFARALGEFGATITFAGNLPGATQTLPLAVYVALERDPRAAVAVALLLLVAAVAVLALLRDRWLRPGTSPP